MSEDVYVTQTGTRYHSRTDEKCMESARSFATVDLATAAAGGLTPCITCDAPPLPDFSEGDQQWLRAIDDWARTGVFDSIWEQAFARRVLANVPGISADDVEPQAYVKAGDETCKVDFLIPKAGLVLEIDGYAKDGTPPTPTDLERRNRRDAALQTQGMTVLHFSNAQVQLEPSGCRQQVASALARRISTSTSAPQPEPPKAVVTPAPDPQPGMSAAGTTQMNGAPPDRKWIWIVVGLAVAIGAVLAVIAILTARAGSSTPEQVGATSSGSFTPTDGVCPAAFPYKGNINEQQERIVHAPGQRFYEVTKAEMCFADVDTAVAAGFRPARQ